MLELQKKHHDTRMERDKELYEWPIKIVDTQIDRLVYDLYGRTEEIEIVEGGGEGKRGRSDGKAFRDAKQKILKTYTTRLSMLKYRVYDLIYAEEYLAIENLA